MGMGKQPSSRAAEKLSPAMVAKWAAKSIMNLQDDEWELRNHQDNGFCWGTAVLAAFAPDLVKQYIVETAPHAASKMPAHQAVDRKVEFIARARVWNAIPPPAPIGTHVAPCSLPQVVRDEQFVYEGREAPCLHLIL